MIRRDEEWEALTAAAEVLKAVSSGRHVEWTCLPISNDTQCWIAPGHLESADERRIARWIDRGERYRARIDGDGNRAPPADQLRPIRPLLETETGRPSVGFQLTDDSLRNSLCVSSRTENAVMSDWISKDDTDEPCPGDCDMRPCDDSFDHAFGVHHVPLYLECNVCGRKEPMPEREF